MNERTELIRGDLGSFVYMYTLEHACVCMCKCVIQIEKGIITKEVSSTGAPV